MLPESEYQTIEGRQYVNPQVALDESTSFIENLRNTQQQNTQQISADTQALGTDVPSSLGGLTGANSYFTARYQTPQTNALVADLRATAQAKALNDALATEQAIWKKRYQDAYRAYQKSQYDKANSPTTTTGPGDMTTEGGVEEDVVEKNDSVSPVSVSETTKDPVMDFIQGKGDWTISYTNGGKTYYGNVYYKTGISGDRYTGLDTSSGMSYSGQNALNFLNNIVSRGGKIYGPDGKEITAQQALTGAPGRW